MELSSELISQFAKITNDEPKTKTESTVYGTTVEYNGKTYVKLDGSDLLTPISTTTDMKPDERVTVMIKNHTAIVTGNISSPAARTTDVQELGTKISEFEIIIADKVDTNQLNAESARIDSLVSENVLIKETLSASSAAIDDLEADNVTITETLTANSASISNLETTKLDASVASLTYATITDLEATDGYIHNLESDYGEFKVLSTNKFTAIESDIENLDVNKLSAETAIATYATIENLTATNTYITNLESDYGEFKTLTANNFGVINASINNLEADKLSVKDAELEYANINFTNIKEAAFKNFYANSGLIQNVVISDGTITGNLVGVTIKGDLIEGGTIIADKLVIQGEDGLYYKLNTNGVTTESEQTEYNSLNGSIITAQSITATKISVDDLVAFDATIGGFNITENSIYSGVKQSVDNTTRGIYLDNDGQIAFGDTGNYIKYYKDTDNNYKLEISAQSILFGTSGKNVETAINEVQDSIDNIEVSGSSINTFSGEYIRTTTDEIVSFYVDADGNTVYFCEVITTLDNVETIINYQVTETDGTYVKSETVLEIAYTDTDKLETTPSVPYSIGDMWITAEGYIKTCIADSGESFNNTDWTESTESLVKSTEQAITDIKNTQSIAENAQETANEAIDGLTYANSIIQMLIDKISMLVVGEDGTTLWEQTDEGWSFNFADATNSINSATTNIETLENTTDGLTSTIDNSLKPGVNDFMKINPYIRFINLINDYGPKVPCVELGAVSSPFKVQITNEEIRFMQEETKVAYINNQALNIDRAVVDNEFGVGGLEWKVRSNGNVGILWKGDE